MSRSGLPRDVIEYPCSDGTPMGETDVHIDCILYVRSALKWYFARAGRQDAYVSANSFLYYEQGNPRAVVAPDVYVVLGRRRTCAIPACCGTSPRGRTSFWK